MEYKGYYIDNINEVKGETIHAWMNAVDEYERLLNQQAEKGDCFEAACEAAKVVEATREAIEAEYRAFHDTPKGVSEFTFSDLFGG